jgi:anaerobic magnesium-protoporphyrin IX monomethyl ester cyclase
MAEILLTHSYLVDYDPKQKKIGQPYPPLGTLYAASIMRECGFFVYFHDSTFLKGPEQIETVIKNVNPGILVIFDDQFSYITKMCLENMREAAILMAKLGRRYGARVILSSQDANDNYKIYLENGIDFVILGEPEITLKELTIRILKEPGNGFEDIHGLAFKTDGHLRINEPRKTIENLDELPFPAWDVIDAEAYRKVWKSKNHFFSINMVTTRGCPYDCIWCAKPLYGNHYSSRSPINVLKEVIILIETHSPDHIWFADDIFGLKPVWISEFATLIHQYGVRIPFSIQSRVDLLLRDDQIQSLVKAGCRKIWLGIESGSQRILDAMKKGITLEQIRTVSPLLRKSGIEQAFFIQLGFPGETKKDILKTIRLLTELMPDDIGVSVTYPLPGTTFFNSVKAKMNVRSNWKDSDDLSLLYESTYSPGFYKLAHRYIHKYYRYKQSAFLLRRVIRNPSGISRLQMRRIILLPYYLTFAIVYKILMSFKENNGK